MSWSEVKKINSDMSKPLDELIDEKFSAGLSSVKSVQTGVVGATCNAGTAHTEDTWYIDVLISNVNPSKCLVFFEGGITNYAIEENGITVAYSHNENNYKVVGRFTSATNLRLSSRGAGGVAVWRMGGRWQVIEFY
ncbi:MAG: hypothetical protein EOM35_09650 [Negativicutes bacterium]|nr:hypothetical protein [Negativicutes bacterium]